MKIFQSTFVREKKMTILGFSRIGINSDSWYEEQKPTGMRFTIREMKKQKDIQITQNYWRLHRSRETLRWGGGGACPLRGETGKQTCPCTSLWALIGTTSCLCGMYSTWGVHTQSSLFWPRKPEESA